MYKENKTKTNVLIMLRIWWVIFWFYKLYINIVVSLLTLLNVNYAIEISVSTIVDK